MPPSPRSPLIRSLLTSLGLVSVLVACSAAQRTKDDPLCTPGAYVFCRCQDREQGTKLCKEDGVSFGPCEPCQAFDDPERPLDPYDPRDPRPGRPDAGPEEPPGICGDGVVQRGEDCDDGNADDTDGCDTDCKLAGDAPFATVACPGLEVHVWGEGHEPSLIVRTTGSGDRSVTPNCTSSTSPGTVYATTGASSPDRVFKVIPHKSGTLTVTTTDANFNSFLYASATCEPDEERQQAVSWLACINRHADESGEELSFPVDAGEAYFVFVDGAGISNNHGRTRVTFSLP